MNRAQDRFLNSGQVRDHLRPFLTWLLARHASQGGRTEIRVIRSGPRPEIWSGTYGPSDIEDLIAQVAPIGPPRDEIPSGDYPRVGEAQFYFTLNPTSLQSPPRLRRGRATKDADVVASSLLMIDIDPVRKPGTSATTVEREAAATVASNVRGWLTDKGVEVIRADSGNGFHLLVPMTPEMDPDAIRRVAGDSRNLLRLLGSHCDTAGANVDTTTYNPSRICKLYGTMAVKGASTEQRPHRRARVDLTAIPEDIDLFTRLGALPERPRKDSAAHRSNPIASSQTEEWRTWRPVALAAVPLELVYGQWLTGTQRGEWLECRDPRANDRNPSAGVADGTGDFERGVFHSFRDRERLSLFDFLILVGEAETFVDSCKIVAMVSGVPLPERRMASTHTEQSRALTATSSPKEIQAVLRELTGACAIERARGLADLAKVTGLSKVVLRDALKELTPRASKRASTREHSERAIIRYVVNEDPVDTLFTKILDVLAPLQRMFATDAGLVWVGKKKQVVVTSLTLSGLLESVLEIEFCQETGAEEPDRLRYEVLPGHLARAFVSSPSVHERLPDLTTVTHTPVFDRAWNYIGSPGYHEPSGIYYKGPTLLPRPGTERIRELLADFNWSSPEDMVNVVGVLLTSLTMPNWRSGHPIVIIDGNKSGVGKSALAKVIGQVIEGKEPASISYNRRDEEFEKTLATRIEAGDRMIFIDNAKGRVDSAVLERCVTDPVLTFRRLGSNSAISRVNDVVFCLTMNLTRLSPDLRRRALPVSLCMAHDTKEIIYAIDDLEEWTRRHREELVRELAGMVLRWVELGRPKCESPARHSTSQCWAATIDAILRGSGFDGFLSNFERMERAFDPRWETICAVAREGWPLGPATAGEWARRLVDGAFFDLARKRNGVMRSERGAATAVGSLFAAYVGQEIAVDEEKAVRLVMAHPRGVTHSPTYHWKAVEPATSAGGSHA